jgi:hypothetical protein
METPFKRSPEQYHDWLVHHPVLLDVATKFAAHIRGDVGRVPDFFDWLEDHAGLSRAVYRVIGPYGEHTPLVLMGMIEDACEAWKESR